MAEKKTQKLLIGRSDMVDLPELGLYEVPAKIDTGAYTSAIHYHSLEVKKEESGKKSIHCLLLDPKHPSYHGRVLVFDDFEMRKITSSNGQTQKRYVIRTTVSLFDKPFSVYFSLARRDKMQFPILIGRRFLESRFIVDVSLYNLSFKQKSKSKSLA